MPTPLASTIVLFGGTGDLATRKLIPALFRLSRTGRLGQSTIMGVGRRCPDRAEYLDFLAAKVTDASESPDDWRSFVQGVEYHQGDVATPADFDSLRRAIERLEKERRLPGARLFYYAVAPELFAPITSGLASVGLLWHGSAVPDRPVGRIIVEKPFGHDLASARQLDADLKAEVDENQIFRIDHYLGKETVQNLIAFRFANGLFEPVWNQKYVESVQLTVAESLGVGGRAAYYDQAGALRDMVQNHMLQLVALTAMEPPISVEADAIRDEKLKVLKSIRLPESAHEVAQTTVRGQYTKGTIDKQSVPGYLNEPGVAAESRTPTYVAARLYLDTWRWANVPFLLRHGKRLAKRGTEIAIQFKTPPLALFRGTNICGTQANLLVIRIQPNEGISLHFGAKIPGAGMQLGSVRMDFDYEQGFRQTIPEAYERLLLDALTGDATLFTRGDEVEASWRWADRVLAGWDNLPDDAPCPYPAGSWGPPEAESLFPAADSVPAGTCPIGWRRW